MSNEPGARRRRRSRVSRSAAAGAVGAPLAVAAVHDDFDVRVVPVVLDEAPVRVFAELRGYHAIDHGALRGCGNGSTCRRWGPESGCVAG